MTEAEQLNELIRSKNGVWFESKHCRIYGKDRKKGLVRPKCNYLQHKIRLTVGRFEDLGLPIRIVGLKPRQKGSTTYFAAEDYTFLRRQPASGIVIGGQYSQVSECWDMFKVYEKNDTFDWNNTGRVNTKDGEWSHGSKLKPETAKDVMAGIGGTHQILHAFEVAKWYKSGVSASASVLNNILKCVPNLPGTMIILESTAEGQNGAFYERFIDAVDAEDFINGTVEIQAGSFVRTFAPWFEFEDSTMDLTDEQKLEIQNTLDEDSEHDGEKQLIELYATTREDGTTILGATVEKHDIWEQLAWRRWSIHEECQKDKNIFDRDYPHSWKVAFQKSGTMRFNLVGVETIAKRAQAVTPMHGVLEETKEGRVTFRQTPENEAKVTIFERPTANRRYILPVDPMTGASQVGGDDPDFHGVFVLREGFWDANGKWARHATAARIIPCQWDIDVLEEQVWRLARYYGPACGCKIVIEMNQDKGLTELLKLRGADLYQREIFNQREFKTTLALGFQTTTKTRENLVEKLAKAVRECSTPGEGIDIWCPHAIEQLENFVRKTNGRSEAAEGFHDDDVLSLALGLEVIEQATLYVPHRGGFLLPPDLRPPPSQGSAPSAYS